MTALLRFKHRKMHEAEDCEGRSSFASFVKTMLQRHKYDMFNLLANSLLLDFTRSVMRSVMGFTNGFEMHFIILHSYLQNAKT